MCQIKLDDNCLGYANQVHHKVGRGVSERDIDLEAACSYCNNQVGDPKDHEDPKPITRTQW